MLPEIVTPVILAGGPGYRLKPWSRPSCPKPFLSLGGVSLLQATLERVKGSNSLILCNRLYKDLAFQQASSIMPQAHFLIEPAARNTAPAIAAAAAWLLVERGAEQVMLVMPSDHAIRQPEILIKSVCNHADMAPGQVVCFGVKPHFPSSRFGYIVPKKETSRFVEKPDRAKAYRLIKQGACWNSGIWMASAGTVRDLFRAHAPDVWDRAQQAVTYSRHEREFTYLEERYFLLSPSVSIDKAVMEKAPKIICVPLDLRWRDLGTWPSMAAHLLGF